MKLSILVMGAHPDDIEIGVGGMVAKLAKQGHQITTCVLTDDPGGNAEQRRSEAVDAAQQLGVPGDQVLFGGFVDGQLDVNSHSVGALRQLLRDRDINPDIVITHSNADSHNDHRAAFNLALSAFREKVVLSYGIVNHLLVSDFAPHVFFDTTEFQEQKTAALKAHKSQDDLGRILWQRIDEYDEKNGRYVAGQYAEALQISAIQYGSDNILRQLDAINENRFNTLWSYLLDDDSLSVIYGEPAFRRNRSHNWPTGKDRDGVQQLRGAFRSNRTYPPHIEEVRATETAVETVLESSHILLGSGPVSNAVTRHYFNHFRGLRYVIDYDMPDFQRIRILDKVAGNYIFAEYDKTPRSMGLIADVGILTIMHNPLNPSKRLVGCMGIHGFGTFACYNILSGSEHLSPVVDAITRANDQGFDGVQFLVHVDARTGVAHIVDEETHMFHSTLAQDAES